jgi:hypothetical protein
MFTPRSRSAALRVLLAVLACSAWMAPTSHAAPAPLTLRYHFVAGQVLTYQQTTTVDGRTIVPGKPVDVTRSVVVTRSHYLFRHVDPGGNATLTVTFDPAQETDTHDGKVSHKTIAAGHYSTPSDACVQEASGTQFCSYRGAYGEGDLGQLPASPVAVGASWNSHIDNTWDVAVRKPVTITNVLQDLSTGSQGEVAEIRSTATIPGVVAPRGVPATPTVVKGSETGTWRFAVDGGMFLSETLRQNVVVKSSVTDAAGTHVATSTEAETNTMQLISVRTMTPKPFAPEGPTAMHTDRTYGYTLTYPRTWQPVSGVTGGFEIASPGGTAAVLVQALPGSLGSSVDLGLLPSLMSGLGTPEGPVHAVLATIHGRQVGVGDDLVKTKKNIEFQVEVRLTGTTRVLLIVFGIATTGLTDGSVRLPTFAHEEEVVQRVLDSLRLQ